MTPQEFEARIVAWARAQPDIEALVQIGSRVQAGAVVDEWSDWDYQVISRNPGRYHGRDWPAQIAPCWSSHFERTERGVTKLSAVFEGGIEADFVLLPVWQIKLVCWGMRRSSAQAWFPSALRDGIHNLHLVASPGYRVVLGGATWEKRYAAIATFRPGRVLTQEDFDHCVAGFWRHAVWVAKKTLRGELRAAVRWSQVELRERTYALLAEEARLLGRTPRPEARQAENWLKDARLKQTSQALGPHRALLRTALLEEMALFEEVSLAVSQARGFALLDYAAVTAWLRTELGGS